jgi:hypothetical protein
MAAPGEPATGAAPAPTRDWRHSPVVARMGFGFVVAVEGEAAENGAAERADRTGDVVVPLAMDFGGLSDKGSGVWTREEVSEAGPLL